MRVKWNSRMKTIQQFMLVDRVKLGFASIPLMYLASTSTTRFLTLMRYALRERNTWNSLYSSSFSWEKWDLWSLSVIEPKWAKRWTWGFSVSQWQSRNPMAICEVSTTRMTGAADV